MHVKSASDQQLTSALKGKGFKVTPARRVVYTALQDQEPQTMHSLILTCLGQVDRATVYRTIILFERLGIVKRLQIGWKYQLELSDDFHYHHHHLTCDNCSRVFPLASDQGLEQSLARLAKKHNFQMRTHEVEIQGLCPKCRPSPI